TARRTVTDAVPASLHRGVLSGFHRSRGHENSGVPAGGLSSTAGWGRPTRAGRRRVFSCYRNALTRSIVHAIATAAIAYAGTARAQRGRPASRSRVRRGSFTRRRLIERSFGNTFPRRDGRAHRPRRGVARSADR